MSFPVLSVTTPGTGPGWERLAQQIAAELPAAQLERIWIFRVLRQGDSDWGTAVLSRTVGERCLVYTARFRLAVKGKSRGAFQAEITEVGSGPIETVEEVLALVPTRGDENDLPVAIDMSLWFPSLAVEDSDASRRC